MRLDGMDVLGLGVDRYTRILFVTLAGVECRESWFLITETCKADCPPRDDL